jgi:hypothetical protein
LSHILPPRIGSATPRVAASIAPPIHNINIVNRAVATVLLLKEFSCSFHES